MSVNTMGEVTDISWIPGSNETGITEMSQLHTFPFFNA